MSARKFLLVPSEAYRELLALSDSGAILAGARGYMDQLLRTTKLNSSAKNALYNQQLRGFLKLRKDTLERPVKVEVAGGPKFLIGNEGVAAYTDAESEKPDEVVQQIPEVNLRQPMSAAQPQPQPRPPPRTQQQQKRKRRAPPRDESSSSSTGEERQQTPPRRTARQATKDQEQNVLHEAP